MVGINWSPTRRQVRQFALLLPLVGAAAGGMLFWRGRPTAAIGVWSGSTAACLASLAVPAIGFVLYRALALIAIPIGTVVSTVVILVAYFLVLAPLGLAFRLVGRDELRLHGRAHASTYWEPKSLPDSKTRYLRQF